MADIQPRFRGPSSVVGAAARVVEWELRAARYALSIPARIAILLEDAELLVARIGSIVDSVERAVAAVDQIILSAARAVDDVDRAVARVSVTLDRVDSAVDTAEEIVLRVDSTVGDAEGLVLRVDSAVGDAEGLVGRVGTAVGDAEGLVLRVDSTVDDAEGLVGRVGTVTGSAEQITERALPVVDFVESTVAQVKPVLEALLLEEGVRAEQATMISTRVTELLVTADEVATRLAPVAGRVVDAVDSEDFEAVLELIDNLPQLITSVERDVLPVVRSLDSVAPEVTEILDVASKCLEALNGIPGFQRLRRRGEIGGRG